MASQQTPRLLFVHAHPDDETINNGATIAHYTARGAEVTVLTCTLGEEGEVIGDRWARLAVDEADQLGGYRIGELTAALGELGAGRPRFLGGAGRWRDSGMAGTPARRRPRFADADLDEAAGQLADVIAELRPHVVVTYDPNGGYGHPDHIQAHRVLMYAVALAAVPSFRLDLGEPWKVSKVYWTALPKGMLRDGIRALREAGEDTGFAAMDPDNLPIGTEDELVTTSVDYSDLLDTKMEALAQHASQVQTDGGFFALSNNLGTKAMGVEHFRIAAGELAGPFDEDGRERDLFNGVTRSE